MVESILVGCPSISPESLVTEPSWPPQQWTPVSDLTIYGQPHRSHVSLVYNPPQICSWYETQAAHAYTSKLTWFISPLFNPQPPNCFSPGKSTRTQLDDLNFKLVLHSGARLGSSTVARSLQVLLSLQCCKSVSRRFQHLLFLLLTTSVHGPLGAGLAAIPGIWVTYI